MDVPTLTATPLVVAEVPSSDQNITGKHEIESTDTSLERTIMIVGGVAGVLGLALIGVAVMAYRQTNRTE
jgi:hypothetical protein